MAQIDDETKAALKRCTAAAEKLLSETARLRRDTLALLERVTPYELEEHEIDRSGSAEIAEVNVSSFDKMYEAIAEARKSIRASEYDLSACRSKLDEIANNTMLRDDLKPWLRGGKNDI